MPQTLLTSSSSLSRRMRFRSQRILWIGVLVEGGWAGSGNTSNVHHHTLLTLSATCSISMGALAKQDAPRISTRCSSHLFQPSLNLRKVAHFASTSLIIFWKPAGGDPADISLGQQTFLLSDQILFSRMYLISYAQLH